MSVVKTFTIRLEEKEVKNLEALKKLVQQKTDNGAIKHLLRNFEDLNKRYVAEMNARMQVQNQLSELEMKVNGFTNSFETLVKAVKKTTKK